MSGAIAVNPGESAEASLARWMPVLAWAFVIFGLSSSYFSADKTYKFIDPILRFFMPRTKPAGWDGGTSSRGAGLSMRALRRRRSFW